jgi:hypothetical protein
MGLLAKYFSKVSKLVSISLAGVNTPNCESKFNSTLLNTQAENSFLFKDLINTSDLAKI